MSRRFYRSNARPQPRAITVKYAGKCACCGAPIKAGEIAMFYPVGTIASRTESAIAHMGGLEGTSARCSSEIAKQYAVDRAVNDYAGDGLDSRYEDQCADICGR